MVIGCLIVPAFPAAAFLHGGGEDRLLVVTEAGRVAAASGPAVRAGVTPGMPAERAAALVPEVQVRPRDPQLEQAVWEELLQALHAVTPFLESPERGMAYLRVREAAPVEACARRLGASAGVAPNRAWARLAAARAAVGHAVTVEPRRVAAFLERFATAWLDRLAFSPEFVERLGLFGYDTLRRAAGLSRRHLEVQFGAEGGRLYGLLHPEDEPPVPLFLPPPTVAASHDFDVPATEPGEVVQALESLAREAVEQLGSVRCRRVKLAVRERGEPAARLACRILPEATASSRRLVQTAGTLLLGLLAPGCEVETVSLELGALQGSAPRQHHLFETRPSLYDAVKAVHRKFPDAIRRAVLHPHALLEEERVHFEPFPAAPPRRRARRAEGCR